MTGKRVGLVIGNDYKNTKNELRYTVADAVRMKEVLENENICNFNEVTSLINKTSRDALIEVEIILKNAEPSDLILIYFTGHGKKDFTNNLYLLFEDTNEGFPLATSLSFDFIDKCRKYPQALKASVIIILDCCYSAAAGMKDTDVTETLANYCSAGTVILTSTGSTGSLTAIEDEKLGHSVFTYYLIEGLEKGYADENQDGYISIGELYKYACKKTKQFCSQSPKKEGKIEGPIIIGKNPLKIKDNEFFRKKKILVDNFKEKLPVNIYDISMSVLVSDHENPEELTENDKKIKDSLEYLIGSKMSIKTYINTVQCYIGDEKFGSVFIPQKSVSSENPKSFNKYSTSESPANRFVLKNSEFHKSFTSTFTGMEFILIPAGKFIMGSLLEEQDRHDECPVHEVVIKNSFYLGKYPVTEKQWEKVMKDNPLNLKTGDQPIEDVSWEEIQEFIIRLNEKEGTNKYCLPTEAEWEYACRAGTQTRYFFGNTESKIDEYCWYNRNSGSETHPVGQKKANQWNLYDMNGNVWEWVQDKWHDNYIGAPLDGSFWENKGSIYRVIRGGSWSDTFKGCRSAKRGKVKLEDHYDNLGFRLLRKL